MSVYPSVKRMDCDKMEESSVQIFIPEHLVKVLPKQKLIA